MYNHWYPKLLRNFILPNYTRWKGKKYLSYYKKLEESQWFSKEEIMKIQWQKLKILLEHSFRHVPYYKKLFNDLKITPNDIRSEEDFKQLPQLTKRIIQKNYHDLSYIKD